MAKRRKQYEPKMCAATGKILATAADVVDDWINYGLCSDVAMLRLAAAFDAIRVDYGSDWKEKRNKALSRDGFACTRCEIKDDLVVHHIRPLVTFQGDHWAAHVLENLLTLCRPCHGVVHAEMKAAA